MGAGNPCSNHGQRTIALAFILEPVPEHENSVGVSAPLPHQPRAGLQHDTRMKG